MTINCITDEKILTVQPVGRLDSQTGDEFLSFVNEKFTDDFEKIIFDLGGVDFVSSKGLRDLVTVYKGLNGREMEIINANTSVNDILNRSGLSKFFNAK